MKTIFRFLMLAILATTLGVGTATIGYAQDAQTEKEKLYKTYMDNYDKDVAKKKIAIEAAKQYMEKFPDDKEQVEYFKTAVPTLEEEIKKFEKSQNDKAIKNRFDAAIKSANIADIYSSGKEVIGIDPSLELDISLVLASAGFDEIVKNQTSSTYNADTINYAKSAIQKLEANTASKTGDYGVLNYSFKNSKFPDTKSNALGAMNYFTGYILYTREGKTDAAKKKEALPYLYKALQSNSFTKTTPGIYQLIGSWYLDEAIRIDNERQAIIKAAGNKDTEESLAKFALQKGYADRAIDAYARAYKLSKDDKTKKDYSDNLYARLKELFTFRFEGNTTGIDAYVASVMSKPLADPSTEVTPVKEEIPATPATTGAAGTTATPVKATAMTSTANDSTPTASSSGTATKAATATPKAATKAATTKTTTKKPAPKKKGTR